MSISACFDVKKDSNKALMRRYGWIEKNKASVGLVGTPETQAQCLQAILTEVWADADGQFDDGWQQLYMLACLKKHFDAFWVADEQAWAEYQRCDQSVRFSMGVQCTGYVISAVHW
jgi:ribonuclease HI